MRKLIFSGMVLASSSLALAASYVAVDYPGAAGTYPLSMNPRGDVVGSYYTTSEFHGFVRSSDRTVASFDPPGSVSSARGRRR